MRNSRRPLWVGAVLLFVSASLAQAQLPIVINGSAIAFHSTRGAALAAVNRTCIARKSRTMDGGLV
jgi:hypothetical protein